MAWCKTCRNSRRRSAARRISRWCAPTPVACGEAAKATFARRGTMAAMSGLDEPGDMDHIPSADDIPSQEARRLLFPDGHFYSPIVDIDDVSARCHEIWPVTAVASGVDFNDAAQQALL